MTIRTYLWTADGWPGITADGYYPPSLEAWTADGAVEPYFLTPPRRWYRAGRRR